MKLPLYVISNMLNVQMPNERATQFSILVELKMLIGNNNS